MSSRLTSESRIYAERARDLNRQVSLMISAAGSMTCVDVSTILLIQMKNKCSYLRNSFLKDMSNKQLFQGEAVCLSSVFFMHLGISPHST